MRYLPPEPVTPERIERALALCAYLVARDEAGAALAPIMDRLEAELAKVRSADDLMRRARRLLQAYAPDRAERLVEISQVRSAACATGAS